MYNYIYYMEILYVEYERECEQVRTQCTLCLPPEQSQLLPGALQELY